MDKMIKYIDFPVLSIGISIPVSFIVLIQISYALEKINPMFTIVINLETFVTFLLVFLAGILVSIISGEIKKGIINGALVGLVGEIIVIIIITVFSVLITPKFQIDQLLSWDFGIYMIFNLLFLTITGSIGGFLGSIINNRIVNKVGK